MVLFFSSNHVNKMHMHHLRTSNSGLLKSLLYAVAFYYSVCSLSVLAESSTISNVMGDEIIICSDDNFKPAPRALGTAPAPSYQYEPGVKETAKKSSALPSNPNYGGITSPNYSTESVANKPKRSMRVDDPLEIMPPDHAAHTASEEVNRNDLWQRIKSGYAMPDSTSPLTKNHENWYSARPDYVRRMVERSQRYLFHVVEEVEKRGMPSEIALLPMIESAYNPQAYSTSRASGIWQFIPSTGKHFGLKQNWWFDNRRNITFATDAALTYLQKLHAMFGAWDLALAAYNAGEGTVSRAIERNRRLGLPTDYESLNLPAETRNYVPKLQAVKNIMTNPSNYGLNIQTIANTPYFAKVTAPAQIDARLAAKLAEISDEEFLALNPSFNRPLIKSEEKNLELLLPIVSAQTFRTNLENYNKPLVSWQTYFAKRGEKLEQIAKQFGIHVSKLRDVNDLPANKKIKKPATIIVPNGKVADFKPDANHAKPTNAVSNPEPVNNPEFEHSISSHHLAVNEETTNTAPTLKENEPNTSASVTHKVARGESIFGIAKRYGMTVKQLKTLNELKSNRLQTGQILTVAGDGQKTTNEAKTVKTYIVKRGDTLHSIAEKFDVAVVDLKRWNNISNNHIQPGSKLTIIQSDAV